MFILKYITRAWMKSHNNATQMTMVLVHMRTCVTEADIYGMLNSLRPRQDGCHFPDDILKCIFLKENVSISIKISLKFIPKGPINNIPALV